MKYHWIGHCKEGTSDKVWGLIRLTGPDDYLQYGYSINDYLVFWGRRGKKLQTQIHKSLNNYDADRLVDKKEARGYNAINVNKLSEVYPEFEQDLESTTMWSLLKA